VEDAGWTSQSNGTWCGYFRHRQSIPGGDGGFGGRFGSGGFGGCIRDGGILLVFGFGSDFGTSW
jgi:hypothetical protein